MEVKDLQPAALWSSFAALNAIPRASKKEEQVIQFILDFGKKTGLETVKDAVGNVVIKKPATPGMENRQTVVLQAHLDMVHQKNGDTTFDFDTQGIDMYIDNEWVKARGTTLGADNGIGVAAIMSVLQATDIIHPALEALFTIDEETGMTGAKEVNPANISGTILLNLDTEEEDEITIGCAGGLDTNTHKRYQQLPVKEGYIAFDIIIKGLMGGHSGIDIHRGRANANKLMNRLLYKAQESFDIHLAALDGGSLRNAIPRESKAWVVIPAAEKAAFLAFVTGFAAVLTAEYHSIEAGLVVVCNEADQPAHVMDHIDFIQMLQAVYATPNGVYRMSPDIEGLVEASNNLARVSVKEGVFITQSLQRSSVASTKEEVALSVKAAFDSIGCMVEQGGEYPGWKPNPDSSILQLLKRLYSNHFEHTPKVGALHAGLECGILGAYFPGMDMVSFGPIIRGAHSPDERVQITSVDRFYNYLLHILREIPAK